MDGLIAIWLVLRFNLLLQPALSFVQVPELQRKPYRMPALTPDTRERAE